MPHSKKDDFIKMELFAHFIMFNAVSRSIANVSAPQASHAYPYAIDFKMACLIVRKYYRLRSTARRDVCRNRILHKSRSRRQEGQA
ncbi:MAG: hypothetical protein NC299_08460 [Lachnospiraceae bacterium]|nr:hypothetical protein [Ruminococcus sp.]MCM1275385.1 hypothetical protein [Lachnospiraceae bacterium]